MRIPIKLNNIYSLCETLGYIYEFKLGWKEKDSHTPVGKTFT